jgi:hypothetical protein
VKKEAPKAAGSGKARGVLKLGEGSGYLLPGASISGAVAPSQPSLTRGVCCQGVRQRADTDDGARRDAESPRSDRGKAARCPVQRLMRARGVVVEAVGPQQPMEVPLVQDQEVVEALCPD